MSRAVPFALARSGDAQAARAEPHGYVTCPRQAGDRVRFAVGTAVLHGTISRVNPRYAHVVCDDDREYRVPYARLTTQARHAETALRAPQRTDGAIQAIAARATAWIVAHRLEGRSFQFDHATKRAGCCNYL